MPPSSLQKNIQELEYLIEQTKVITSTRNRETTGNGSNWEEELDTDGEDSSEDEDSTDTIEELRLRTQWLTQLRPALEQNLASA